MLPLEGDEILARLFIKYACGFRKAFVSRAVKDIADNAAVKAQLSAEAYDSVDSDRLSQYIFAQTLGVGCAVKQQHVIR